MYEPNLSSTFVLLDDSLASDGASSLFESPEDIIVCDSPEAVEDALSKLEGGLNLGLHAAGFLSYELGYLMEPKLESLLPVKREQPLIWMGLFKERSVFTEGGAPDWIERRSQGSYHVGELNLSISKDEYHEAFAKAQDYIAAGDVYQINLTLKYLFPFSGEPLRLYLDLRRKQKVAYGGIISTADFDVLSFSPELFFRRDGRDICSRPMKGTAARGLTPEQDREIANWLSADEKSRAENLMIVDLLRNDLGRVAEIGSVHVTDLFTVETYRTIHQMTSGIRAHLRDGITLGDILRAIFPCGSVTGAPKVRAMEIIRELESAPRGVYTGAFGTISPDGNACFNVPIRTLFLSRDGLGEMGIGSGIVADSDGEAEFEECLLKAHFLTKPLPEFELIETLRWQQGEGYFLFDRHLDRLESSAKHFGFRYDRDKVLDLLKREAQGFTGNTYMVRFLLNEGGEMTVSATEIELPAPDTIWWFVVSDLRADEGNMFFYHKTTKRDFYNDEWNRQKQETGCDEVLFLNKRGELTEGTRTNIFLVKDGQLLTPALPSGLLAGTLREELIQNGPDKVKEAVLTLDDLEEADRIFLGNSVRGLVEARRLAMENTDALSRFANARA